MIDQATACNCTGCSACVNACPVNAVSLKANEQGFCYPHVDYDKCIKCQKCLKVCPSLNPLVVTRDWDPDVYAAWNRDEHIRVESTSGGVFSALADAVLRRGGYVAGAVYDNDFVIRHTLIHSVYDIKHQRQSKYAQSELGTIFREIKALLQSGRLVLFCGTPCQSAGLQKYLGKEYENLICCDFICRGVISPKVYQKFLNDMKPDVQADLQRVHFKNKDFGWNRFSTKLTFSDGRTYHRDRNEDYYMRGYLRHNLYLRDCCYRCDYKTLPRGSDISLGDFWGIGNYDVSLDNEQGTSVVIVNSQKGRELLSWASDSLALFKRTMEEALAGNSCLRNSAAPGKYRAYFFKKMDYVPFAELIEKIDKKTGKQKLSERILQWISLIKHKITGVL